MQADFAEWTAKLNANAKSAAQMRIVASLIENGTLRVPVPMPINSEDDRWDTAEDLKLAGWVWRTAAATLRSALEINAYNGAPLRADDSASALEIGPMDAIGNDYLRLADYLSRGREPASEEIVASGFSTSRTEEILRDALSALAAINA